MCVYNDPEGKVSIICIVLLHFVFFVMNVVKRTVYQLGILLIVQYSKGVASDYESNPVIWLLKSHSCLAAVSSLEAAVVNDFSLQSEKYFPDTPSSSSATAQWIVVCAPCLGVFMKRTDIGYATNYKEKDRGHN